MRKEKGSSPRRLAPPTPLMQRKVESAKKHQVTSRRRRQTSHGARGDQGFVRLIAPLWLIVAIAAALAPEPSVATRGISIGTLLLLPGAALLALVRLPFRSSAGRIVATVALSVVILMAASLLLSVAGPLFGVDKPLDAAIAGPALAMAGGLLVIGGGIRRRDAGVYLLRGVTVGGILVFALLMALPLLALLGAERLDAGAPGDIAVAVTSVTVLLLLFALVAALGGRRPPVAALLFFAVLATAYAVAARGTVLFGWDIQKELAVALETIDRGRWVIPTDQDAYAAMLSLTGLPALIGDVGRLTAAETLRYVFPVFSALTVVGVHEACRRVAPRGPALSAVLLLVVGSIALPRGMQAIARQETAFLLVAAMTLIAFESRLTLRARRSAVLLAGAGIAVAHYSTGYAMIVLLTTTAFAGTLLAIRRPALRHVRVFSPIVVTAFATIVIGWNAVLIGSTAELNRLNSTLMSTGLNLLPRNGGQGLVEAWLNGPEGALAPVEEYHRAVADRVANGQLFVVDPTAAAVELKDAEAPRIEGIAPTLAPAYLITSGVARQAVLIVAVATVLASLLALRRQRSSEMTELALLAAATIVMVVLLRLSGAIALFYNPERSALHAAMIYAPVVAIAFTQLLNARSLLRVITKLLIPTASAVSLTSALALGPQLVGGSPSAAHANVGEEFERSAVSRAEYATALWISERDDDPLNVFSDRYGQIVLLGMPRGTISISPTIDPSGVDQLAYVYASRTNIVEGRARGKEGRIFSTFVFPVNFFVNTRATVFSTEETRVFR